MNWTDKPPEEPGIFCEYTVITSFISGVIERGVSTVDLIDVSRADDGKLQYAYFQDSDYYPVPDAHVSELVLLDGRIICVATQAWLGPVDSPEVSAADKVRLTTQGMRRLNELIDEHYQNQRANENEPKRPGDLGGTKPA